MKHSNKHKQKRFEKIPKYNATHYESKYDNMMEAAKEARFNSDYKLAEDLLIEVFASDCHLKNRARLELAKLYKETGNYDKAKWILNVICNEPSVAFESYYELAMVHIIENNFNEAEDCLSKIQNGFNQFLYNEGMGKLKYYTRDYVASKGYFNKARSIKGYISRGNSIRMILMDIQMGNYDEALEGINQSRNYWYNHTSILLEGNVYIQQQKYAEALKMYQRLLPTRYKNAALYRIGYVYLLERKYKEASSVLSRVYSDIRNHVRFDGVEFISIENLLYYLIMSYVKSGVYEEPIKIIEECGLIENDIYNYYYKIYSFCCRKANIKQKIGCSTDLLSYSGFQSCRYKKDAAYAHIKRRHIEQSEKRGTILSNTNIDEVWEYALNNISQNNRTDYMSFADVYSIDYPNIGINGEDKLIVVTNPGTDEIITLYPEFGEKVYLHDVDRDEEAQGIYTADDFKGTDVIIRGLVKED